MERIIKKINFQKPDRQSQSRAHGTMVRCWFLHAGRIRRITFQRKRSECPKDCASRFRALRLSSCVYRFNQGVLNRLLALALALSGPAVALAGSSGAVTLSGSVEPRCEISASPASADLSVLNGVGSKELSFTYTCNTPFAYQLQSANGALKHKTLEAPTGFFNRLVYTVEVNLPTDGSPIDQTVISSDVVEGSTTTFANSGSAIAIHKTGTIMLRWNAPEFATTAPLLAGDYGDSLTLTLSAQQ